MIKEVGDLHENANVWEIPILTTYVFITQWTHLEILTTVANLWTAIKNVSFQYPFYNLIKLLYIYNSQREHLLQVRARNHRDRSCLLRNHYWTHLVIWYYQYNLRWFVVIHSKNSIQKNQETHYWRWQKPSCVKTCKEKYKIFKREETQWILFSFLDNIYTNFI